MQVLYLEIKIIELNGSITNSIDNLICNILSNILTFKTLLVVKLFH